MVKAMSTVVNGMLSLTREMSPSLVRPIGAHGGKVMYLGNFCVRGNLGYQNCYDLCMCIVNK